MNWMIIAAKVLAFVLKIIAAILVIAAFAVVFLWLEMLSLTY